MQGSKSTIPAVLSILQASTIVAHNKERQAAQHQTPLQTRLCCPLNFACNCLELACSKPSSRVDLKLESKFEIEIGSGGRSLPTISGPKRLPRTTGPGWTPAAAAVTRPYRYYSLSLAPDYTLGNRKSPHSNPPLSHLSSLHSFHPVVCTHTPLPPPTTASTSLGHGITTPQNTPLHSPRTVTPPPPPPSQCRRIGDRSGNSPRASDCPLNIFLRSMI